MTKHPPLNPSPVCLAEPQPGDFCCIPVPGGFGTAIEFGQYLAERLQGHAAQLQPYDHAQVYVGQADMRGPYGYTYSAYPDNGTGGKTGKRALPCPPAKLPGSLWSSGIVELTSAQRSGIVAWCVSHPCVSYSWLDYEAIAARALRVPVPGLRGFIRDTRRMICSYYTDAAWSRGGEVSLFQDGRWEGYVTPGDLALALQQRLSYSHV